MAEYIKREDALHASEGSWEHPIDTDALYCKHCGVKMED